MIIEQTIEVPPSRRITFEVPPQIPTGAQVVIQFPVEEQPLSPVPKGSFRLSKRELDEILQRPHPITDSLVGILSDLGDIDLDEIRMERLAKHLQ